MKGKATPPPEKRQTPRPAPAVKKLISDAQARINAKGSKT